MKSTALGTLSLCAALSLAPDLRAVEPTLFIRGDANADGSLSTADILTIQRWLFSGDQPPTCIDAADVNDDGRVNICDAIGVGVYLFQTGACQNIDVPVEYGQAPPSPFPAPGEDPTPDHPEAAYMSCESFTVSPPEATDDLIRLGDVEVAGGGETVEIPVYVTNALPVEAVQLVVKYDPEVVRIGHTEAVTYGGTYYEQFKDKVFTTPWGHGTYHEPATFARSHPEDGFFTASIVPDLLALGTFQVPAGSETLVAKILVEVSPDVPAGTLIHIDPMDGIDGEGYGPFRLRNELTYEGAGRYPTIAPRTQGGVLHIGVDGDISFFVRGDANGDAEINISDPVFILSYLFRGGDEPRCQDAADADDDGAILITDATTILSQIFLGQDTISPPYPNEGPDSRWDFLERCEPRD